MNLKIKNKLNIWEYKEYSHWYRIDKKIKLFFQKIKWMFQRAKYGYCDKDLWNLDYTLGNYIAATTKEFSKRTHGYPYDITEAEWSAILNSISNSFYLGTNEECWSNPYKTWEKYAEKNEENYLSMKIRRQEGFSLLEKWFSNLWD